MHFQHNARAEPNKENLRSSTISTLALTGTPHWSAETARPVARTSTTRSSLSSRKTTPSHQSRPLSSKYRATS